MSYHPGSINQDTFRQALDRYADTVDSSLQDLDKLRYKTVPDKLRGSKVPELLKTELTRLVEWKLRHGTWRPSLAKLAESNSGEDVSGHSKAAFARVASEDLGTSAITAALGDLTKLRGIGPATASLVLSCARPDRIPFFSDELFRWLHWDDAPTKGTTEWQRKISYSGKEYSSLVQRAEALRMRLQGKTDDVSAWMLEAEKVAYVLGQEAAGVKAPEAEEDQPIEPTLPTSKEDTQREQHKSSGHLSHAKSPTQPPAKGARMSNKRKQAADDARSADHAPPTRRSKRNRT